MRGIRLRLAFASFNGSNREVDPLRALGSNLQRGERERNAVRAVLLCLAMMDPDANEYLAEVTSWRAGLGKAAMILPSMGDPTRSHSFQPRSSKRCTRLSRFSWIVRSDQHRKVK